MPPPLSHEYRVALDELNAMFIQALRSTGFQDGEKINVLVTTKVLQVDREKVRRIFAERDFKNVHESASGLFRKRYSFEARSADFAFSELKLVEWNEWSFTAHRNDCIVLSIGVCKAE